MVHTRYQQGLYLFTIKCTAYLHNNKEDYLQFVGSKMNHLI